MDETTVSNVTNCNQCHNACRLEEVKCGRGEKYREYLKNGGTPENYVPEKREGHDGAEGGRRHEKYGRHGHHHRNHGN